MGEPPLLDEVADLKLNSLEVVGAVSQRRALLQVWHQNYTSAWIGTLLCC